MMVELSFPKMQTSSCCVPSTNGATRYNSAYRLSHSLQLLPCYNEKHQLIAVHPRPHSHKCKMNSRHGASDNNNNTSRSYSIWWLPVVIALATLALYGLSTMFLDAVGESHQLKFPTSVEDIREMTDFLLLAKENHPFHLLALFSSAYLYKQTFAIPGSVFLNLLAGALFGVPLGLVLTSTLTALGATNCYLLSRTFGKAHVIKYFPDKVRFFQEKIESNKDSLFFFLLFLRLFPMFPNWALNMICPILGVPIHYFLLSSFIGLMPYNFVCVQTGDVLSQISSVNDIFDTWTLGKMVIVAMVALLPGVLIKKFHIKED